jgi:hypothetical protein
MERHGDEVDLILEHFFNGKSAPFGLLFKSHKTGRYHWYSRKQLQPIGFYDGDKIPALLEGIDTYTPNKQLVYEYLDHVMDNVLSKRDKKKFGPIYENVKADQLSLIDRLNIA